jgi:hypothetical protein
MTDDFFQPLENTNAYWKCALEGFAGSGKSYTMALMGVGLHAFTKSTKPVVLFDTEESGKFLIPHFRKAGIQVLHKRSRSLADLITTMQKCKDGASDILLIDSSTHVWENFVEAFRQKVRNGGMLEFQDWARIKPEWKAKFAEPFVRSHFHIIMTGRAGYEYEDYKDERGKRQIAKSGIKMKMEGESAHEPDMVILMERQEELLEKQKKIWRTATILKDRADLIDSQTFINPKFDVFQPSIAQLLDNVSTLEAPPAADDKRLIQTEEDKRAWLKRRDIALEEIEGLLVKAFPGSTGPAKAAKGDCLEHGFGTRSWTKIESLPSELLEQTIPILKRWLEAKQREARDQAS